MSDSASKAAENFSHIHGHNKKSIEIEPETWEQLNKWSEQECRTIGGQIKYLVKQYAPQLKIPENSGFSQSKVHLKTPLKPTQKKRSHYSEDKNGWEYASLGQNHLKRNTQRMGLLEALIEYSEPVTNTDLLLLAQAKFPDWKNLDIEVVTKQTSNLFHAGLLKRRISQNFKIGDQYQYILHPRTMKLVNRTRNM
jgi:hypothetical protein